MGNELAKKYDIPEQHVATAGNNQMWKIFPCSLKETNSGSSKDVSSQKKKPEEMSIWLFNKDDLAKRSPPLTDKSQVEQITQIMKKDILCFKDMSHAGIVRIVEVLEDNKKVFAVVTEKIICSLHDLLNRFEHIPSRYSWHSSYLEENGAISEIEISRGLLSIAEGLQYMHTVKRRLHLNVSPGNCYYKMSYFIIS
jgi:hypothetical protein